MGCLLSDRGKFPATILLIDENRWYPTTIVIEALPGIGSGRRVGTGSICCAIVLGKNQFIDGKSQGLSFGNQPVHDGRLELWIPRQDPQIPGTGSDHHGVTVFLVVQVHNVVSTVERPEKRDLEASDIRIPQEVGFALGFRPLSFFRIEAAIDDAYAVVLPKAVLCLYPGQAPLESYALPTPLAV
ncbi:MAG: hypothetical protein ACI88G_002123 [Woeseiaceae bacterium]|jgi:hypothetical protein